MNTRIRTKPSRKEETRRSIGEGQKRKKEWELKLLETGKRAMVRSVELPKIKRSLTFPREIYKGFPKDIKRNKKD